MATPTEYPDQAESAVDNVEWTTWEAENQADCTAYDTDV